MRTKIIAYSTTILTLIIVVTSVTLSKEYYSHCSITYNRLVQLESEIQQQTNQLKGQYKFRNELITNMINALSKVDKSSVGITEKLQKLNENSGDVNTFELKNDEFTKYFKKQSEVSVQLDKTITELSQNSKLKNNSGFVELEATIAGSDNRVQVEKDKLNEFIEKYNELNSNKPSIINWFSKFGKYEKI